MHYKLFTFDRPVNAAYVRFWTDSAIGETKTNAQVVEVQVFSQSVKGVEPLPPSPPDPPVTDTGLIVAANPSTGTVDDATGVTANAFKAICDVPPAPAQGADGCVTKLPASLGDSESRRGRTRRALTTVAATVGACVVVLGAGAVPAHAGSVNWGSLNCGSKYVYSKTFSAGYTYHRHRIVGYTHWMDWNVPPSGEWHTYHPGWTYVVDSYVSADVLESASRGCDNISP